MAEKFRILARHKNWVSGATITESVRRDDGADENGISIRRFTATIRGFRNWKIYEGPAANNLVEPIIEAVSYIRDEIDKGDKYIFERINEYVTIAPGWQIVNMKDYPHGWLNKYEKADIYRWRPSSSSTLLPLREYVELQVFDLTCPEVGWQDVHNVGYLIHATRLSLKENGEWRT